MFVLKAGRQTSSVVSEMTLSLARKTRLRKNHDARVEARAASCAQLIGDANATKTVALKHVCILHHLCGVSNSRYTTKYFVCKPQTCQLEAPTFNFLWSFLRIRSSATYAPSVSVYLGVQTAHRRNISRACACGVVELLSMNGIWKNEQHQRSNQYKNAVPRCCNPVSPPPRLFGAPHEYFCPNLRFTESRYQLLSKDGNRPVYRSHQPLCAYCSFRGR